MNSPAGQSRVLVVDDEADVRLLLSRVLKEGGYQVEIAADGAEALAKIAEARPDLVLLDLMMPGVDGWTVLGEIKKGATAPPVILVTASAEPTTFGRSVREGVAGYLSKPFRVRELLGTCARVLAERRERGSILPVERRRNPRQALMVEVRVVAKGAGPDALGELVDFGSGGVQVYLDAALEPGTLLHVTFRVGGGETCGFDARVRWQRNIPQGAAHGLAFVGLEPEAERRLMELVKLRRP